MASHTHSTLIIFALFLPLAFAIPYYSKHFHNSNFSPYPHSFSGDEPSTKAAHRVFKNLIGDDGRIYACSRNNFFSFENNGSIAWMLHLNFTCNPNIAPVHGGSTKIYLVAENRVLKIYPSRIGTSEAAVEVFFGPRRGAEESGEIIGISASISSSCLLINVKNRGLFSYRLYGQLLWSAGPVLYQHGYRQGCRKNITDCYFTSPPVIDHCEATIFISNTVGELYSLSIRGPYFKWIQDLSSFGNAFTTTSGNNGRLYVTVPDRGLVVALDVQTGSILWQGNFGPLSSADYEPVIDANGWISYGSLDGYLYSFSPTGVLRKFPESASLNSVILVNPVLDCSGYAVYISQTEMEEKISQKIGEYTYVSALKPKSVAFTCLVPASGSIYSSQTHDPSKFLFNLSQSDLQHFMVDQRVLLAFFAVTRNGNALPCRTTRQKLASSCSQVKPKSISIYSVLVRYCCIFWKKKKLQGSDLGRFLEKRRSLRSEKKAMDGMITELEQKASEEAAGNEVVEKLGYLVKEREDISRKLLTTYSLGRDGEKRGPKSLLPLYDGKARSYAFHESKNVRIFQGHNDSSSSSSSEGYNSLMEEADDEVGADDEIHEKEHIAIATTSSSSHGLENPKFYKHSHSEIKEMKSSGEEITVGNSHRRSLRRRTVSFNA